MRSTHILAVAAGAALVAGALAGCSSSGGGNSQSQTTGAPVTGAASNVPSGKGKSVVYIPGLTGVPFYSSVSCGATAEAKKLGVKFSTQGSPTFSVDSQTQILTSVVADKPNAIMISITDPKAMIAPLAQAKAAGIKIIGIDGDLIDKSIMSTNIQSNNVQGGALAADALGQAMGGKGSVVMIDNATGSIISGDRQKGFEQELKKKFPNIKNLGVQYSANEVDKAASIASSAASNKSVTGIYALETNNTQGAITGIREAGKVGKVHVVGYDTSDPIVQALRQKQIDALIVQYPYGEGQVGIDSAVKLLAGQSVPRQQTSPFVVATPQNVDTPKVQRYIYKVTC